MKRYYDALDVPQSATIDQIKAQYKQLVRVYHPDRFADAEAKAQAEERFKAINEAYRALTELADQRGKQISGPKPKPVVDLDLLNFGTLYRGEKRVMSFQAKNAGEPTTNVNYRFSSNAPWFKVAEIQPLQPDQPLPLVFKVETTVDELTHVGDYSGLIEVNMDGQIAFVHLSMRLTDQRAGWRWPKRKLVYLAAGLLLCIGIAGFPYFGNFAPQLLGIPADVATAQTEPPVVDAPVAVPVAAVALTTQQTKSLAEAKSAPDSEWLPIFSPDNSQIAFISNELGAPQVYVRDPQSGKLRQLTESPEPKAKLLWSPDSLKLAYIAGDLENARIHVVDVKRSHVQELAPIALPGIIKHFIWATDSQSVIFDYYVGQEQRFYRGDFQQKESILFVPPADWDTSWAFASD